MRIQALATDYDGTLAHDGAVDAPTLAALDRFRESGRRLVLVTGRLLEDLQCVFPQFDRFDLIVAENGALLYRPVSKKLKMLCAAPPAVFAQRLRAAGATPLEIGHAIVATREPYETVVIELIKELGLELQIIFNKGAVMILPTGVNKATGLKAGLRDIGLAPECVAGVGDAENDHAFLEICCVGIAVANALPMLKKYADIITNGACGAGVTELIDSILADELAGVAHCGPLA